MFDCDTFGWCPHHFKPCLPGTEFYFRDIVETIMTKYGEFKETSGWTDIFIYPGYNFKAIDAQITNFHLPKSTLIMLVSAFSTKQIILNAYQEAVKNKYRFFSFENFFHIIIDCDNIAVSQHSELIS